MRTKNKRGMSTFQLFLYGFVVFFLAVFLGVALWIFGLFNTAFDQDIAVGQVNLATINNQTFGQINQGFINGADNIGIILIIGLVFLMLLNAYYLGSGYPKVFFIVDIFLIVFAFVLAVYLSQTYEIFINASSDLSNIYVNQIPKTSAFVLNLPYYVSVIGALIMIVSYAGLRKDKNEDINVYGY